MRRWPWISIALSVFFIITPGGREIIHSAFYSGEQLARSLSQVVLYVIAGIMVGAIFLEWLIRWWLSKRRSA